MNGNGFYFHSDMNFDFVSNPYPSFNEQVSIKFRCIDTKEIKKVFIRAIVDGTNLMLKMDKRHVKDGFAYYEGFLIVTQKVTNYHFIIITGDKVYYYNKLTTTLYPPTEDYDFVIIADFKNPSWVPGSVFYQIFPDRFKRGANFDEAKFIGYTENGYSSRLVKWDSLPLPYSEGHCLDFYGGDIDGIREAIPYFKELGVKCLYVNPIFRSNTNHRYDCIDYFNVDEKLGGNKALELLTKELHDNGMKIIVDVSINHTGNAHPWLKKAFENPLSVENGFYYINNGKARTWLGVESLVQLNFGCPALREILYKSKDSFIKKFLSPPYNIDGWRFDVGNNTGRAGRDQYGNEVFREVRDAAKSVKNDCYLIGEHWKDCISYLAGDQWDGAMNYFGCARPIRSFVGENDRYLRGMLGKDGAFFVSGGVELKSQIEQHNCRLPSQISNLQFNLIDSHDVHRLHNNNDIYSFALYKSALIIMFMLPGTVSVYYGDEVGLQGNMDTIENARYPMQWDRTKWDNDIFTLYKTLIKIKTDYSELHYGSMVIPYADEDTIVIVRFNLQGVVVGVAYKGEQKKSIEIDLKTAGVSGSLEFCELISSRHYDCEKGILSLNLEGKESLIMHSVLRGS